MKQIIKGKVTCYYKFSDIQFDYKDLQVIYKLIIFIKYWRNVIESSIHYHCI